MTRRTLCWRWLEHSHRFSLNELNVLMASGALDAAMFAGKRKPRPTVVVELRRNPPCTAVAVSTSRDFVGLGELPEVKLLVASLAFAGGGLEIHLL